ncbi:hypothetical protein MMC72_004965 [Salmonella enterica]|nr:hypothetical protein [Salmonella enterica]
MSEEKVKLLALCILCTPLASSAQDFSPEFVRHVFLNLDMTSFPSSMGPKHFPDGTTMREVFKYFNSGVLRKCNKKNCVEVFFPDDINKKNYTDEDTGWIYDLTILSVDNKNISACFIDYCKSNCSYLVVQPLNIREKKGKFVVTHAYNKSIKGCKYYVDGGDG